MTVDEARAIVRARVAPLEAAEEVPLAEARGRALAEPVRADRDDPPFDRAMMDGYALRAADAAGAPRALDVVGRIAAGDARLPGIGPGQAAWINTGAPLPPGADAVVPVEQTEGDVTVLATAEPWSHVLRRGALASAGDAVVPAGLLTPERIAVCAASGADPVRVRRRPRVAVLATGAELKREPGAHEIRNSNGALLGAIFGGACEVTDLGTVADDPAALEDAIGRGLEAGVLVTTGGVSKGELDLVRPALEARGVEVGFHRIALQPGKPVLFGTHERGVVFALPGNPVSALVCADLFAVPYVAALLGEDFDSCPRPARGRATGAIRASPKRRRVFPCLLRDGAVEPLPWRGSADLYTVTRANAYMVVEIGRDLARGEEVSCLVPQRF